MSSALLPQAVRKQIDQANLIAAEYYKSQQGTPPGDTPLTGTPPANEPPAGTPPVAATPPAPNGETPPAPSPPAVEEWKQKYQVLQGKYNAEVPRLQNQVRTYGEDIRQLREQLTATQNLLASLSTQQTPAPAVTPPAPTRHVKDEEIKEFGADLIDVMRRVAREENASLLPEIDRRVTPVSKRVDQVAQAAASVGQRVAQSDQQSVISMLAQAVPEWQKQNRDPGFLGWLEERDPFSGQQRGALLSQAFEANDGPRVVAFFNGYLKEHATVTPPAPPVPPAPQPGTQRRLESFVAPGTPKTGAASTQNGSEKRVWTRAEIGQFYADSQAGRLKGTAAERKALEADIYAAQREGRIR